MKCINKSELQIIKQINYGSFSHVFEVYYNGSLFCYKQFRVNYPPDILKNICEMTDEEYSSEYAVPLVIVMDYDKIIGYLCDMKLNAIELDDVFDIQKKKILLKKAKMVLQKLHSEYKRIHGDVNYANFIYNQDSNSAFLIDFDSSLKIGQEIGSTISFPEYLLDYLKYYQFDYLADIYEFNLNTLVLLTKKNHRILLDEIANGIYPVGEGLIRVRKLCDELVLAYPKRKISGDFIIDYL